MIGLDGLQFQSDECSSFHSVHLGDVSSTFKTELHNRNFLPFHMLQKIVNWTLRPNLRESGMQDEGWLWFRAQKIFKYILTYLEEVSFHELDSQALSLQWVKTERRVVCICCLWAVCLEPTEMLEHWTADPWRYHNDGRQSGIRKRQIMLGSYPEKLVSEAGENVARHAFALSSVSLAACKGGTDVTVTFSSQVEKPFGDREQVW